MLPDRPRPLHGPPTARVAPADEVLLDTPDPLRTPHASPGRGRLRRAEGAAEDRDDA